MRSTTRVPTFMGIACLVLGNVLVAGLSACGPREPVAPKLEFTPPEQKSSEAVAATVDPASVKILDGGVELPTGFKYSESDSPRMAVAADYPSAADPNRFVGTIEITVPAPDDLEPPEDPSKPFARAPLPPLGDAAIAELRRDAAARGANTLVLRSSHRERMAWSDPVRHRRYDAFYVSSAAPEYVSVEGALLRIGLAKDGFKEIKRVTVDLGKLADDGLREVSLERGKIYWLALALHPEPVSLDPSGLIGVHVGSDTAFAFSDFDQRVDRPVRPHMSTQGIDGVWARAGAFKFNHDLFTTEKPKLAYATRASGNHFQPPVASGKADLVLYEHAVTPAEMTDAACGRCYDTATSCSKRRELSACQELIACFATIQMPLAGCNKSYEKL